MSQGGLLNRFVRWLSRPLGWLARGELPEEIRALLMQGNALALKAYIEQAAKAGDKSRHLIESLLSEATANHWPQDEITKIRIYAAYFSGNTAAARREIIGGGFADTDFDLYVLVCIALYVDDSYEEAYRFLKRRQLADAGFATHVDFLSFAGYIVLAAGGPIEEALGYLDYALDKGLCSAAFLTNAYPIYFEAGRLDAAGKIRQIIHEKFGESNPEINFSLACVELVRGYYPEGFRLAEWRYRHPEVRNYINSRLLDKPLWQGENLKGKTVLVHAEQGLGDAILCARFLPDLTRMAGKVILECQEEAITLLEHAYPDVKIIPTQKGSAADMHFDFWIGAMSLPHRFDVTKDTVPRKAGYLQVPGEHAAYWKEKILDLAIPGKLRVGIAWSGNPRHRADRRRSIQFQIVRPYMASAKEAVFFPLQTSVPKDLPENVVDVSEELVTLADTAALAMEMDVVITVDTSIVHIAGALGKKAWLVFPYRYDWRWGLEGESNSWYDSVLVVRQRCFGDWKPVLDEVFGRRLPELAQVIGASR